MVIKSMTDTKRLIRCMVVITVEFTPGFDWVHVAKCLVFCVVLYRSLFLLFSLDVFIFDHCIVYPSSITASKYTFCNFKAFLIGIGGRRGRDRMVVGFQLPINTITLTLFHLGTPLIYDL
jgi:hypothetical protein